MSVDTYIGNRNTRNYQVVRQDGVEVLVSNALAPYIRRIDLECKKFLFMHKLKATLEMRNGMIVAA
ncbi:MAG: hypothetical protein IIB14_07150 [Chloroflexi bacterium]|nr:hypothetical protein [Chloroflexota bacterium]